jgi:hypothetical protein
MFMDGATVKCSPVESPPGAVTEVPEDSENAQGWSAGQVFCGTTLVQLPQTARDGNVGHVQFAVPQYTGNSDILLAMIPS